MRIFQEMVIFLLMETLVLSPSVYRQNIATVECNNGGSLSGNYADVIVNSGCILDGAMVFGSVIVEGGPQLTVSGGAIILGSITVGAGNYFINNATVSGDISLKEAGDLTIGQSTNISAVKVESSGSMTVTNGSVAAIESNESKGVTLKGATVFPGGVGVNLGEGALSICGRMTEQL